MKWIPVLMLSFAMLGAAQAAGPDDQYIEIYSLIQQADGLSNDPRAAVAQYTQAQNGLKRLNSVYPSWNPDIVKFRLDYVADKLAAAEKALSQATSASAAATVAAMPKIVTTQELQQQISELNHQVQALQEDKSGLEKKLKETLSVQLITTQELQQQISELNHQGQALQEDKSGLEKKLKEALSVQPAAVDPNELVKAEQTITALKKEKDLLTASLEQEKAARTGVEQKTLPEADAKKIKDETKKANVLANERDVLQVRVKELEKSIVKLQTQAAEERDAAAKKLAAINKQLSEAKSKTEAPAKSKSSWRFWSSDKKSQTPPPAKPDQSSLKKLEDQRADLEKKLAAANKELAEVKSHTEKELEASRAAAKKSEDQRADLEKKLTAATKELSEAKAQTPVKSSATVAVPAPQSPGFLKRIFVGGDKSASKSETKKETTQVAQLRARVAALEASPVPYTKEELALMTPPPTQLAAFSAPAAKSGAHSIKDLPPGAGALMAEAQRAFMAGDYAVAETKYAEVLRQDEKNVYVLSHLASAQLSAGHATECEKSVQQALALDANDAASLFLLGNLRLRQDKLDEALNALSRSSEINPTNAATQNALGGVLNQKGLRKPAEAALRKALQLDPGYAEAHHNLAIVYATQNPPFMELGRWHYKKAIDLGHPRNPNLEKLLGTN